MNCPNCQQPFALESNGKFHCETCGWFKNVGDPNPEWHTCEAPEPTRTPEPNPAALDPDPAKLEPGPVVNEPGPVVNEPGPITEPQPEPQVKEYFGGKVTFTEVDE